LATRDLIVVGGSNGALDPLRTIVRELPPDLPAAMAVVLHHSEDAAPMLAGLLAASGRMPVIVADDGTAIERGRIYLPPPDRHLLVGDSVFRVSRGPRENFARPAVDPLFRSAARSAGARAVGVLLSGSLDDGTSGLVAIKRRGGLAIVQDPAEAQSPAMLESALEYVDVDHVGSPERIARLLLELGGSAVPDAQAQATDDPELLPHEHPQEDLGMDVAKETGRPSTFVCPDCGGVLWEVDDGKLVRFRCHTGHAYGPQSLAEGNIDTIEVALWTALRSLKERSELLARGLNKAVDRGSRRDMQRREEQLEFAQRQISALRALIDSLP
jgi:two-component system chemotaxis response regulator CheB